MSTGTYIKNPQGFEQTYATNVLSQYLLTLYLLPSLNKGGRIVNVSSGASYNVSKQVDPTDLDRSKYIEGKLGLKPGDPLPPRETLDLYYRSKLLQIFLTREMQLRLEKSSTYSSSGKHITVHSYHPGKTFLPPRALIET